MNENSKIQVVANDLVRRLLNNCEDLGPEEYAKVVDQYAQKLLNSGYDHNQARRILITGIKGFEGKVRRYEEEKRRLRRTAKQSQGARIKKTIDGEEHVV